MLEDHGYVHFLMQPSLCCIDPLRKCAVEGAGAWCSDTAQSISAAVLCFPTSGLETGWHWWMRDNTHGRSLKRHKNEKGKGEKGRSWTRREDSRTGTRYQRCQRGQEFTCLWNSLASLTERKQIKLPKYISPWRCLTGLRTAYSCWLSQWPEATVMSLYHFFL